MGSRGHVAATSGGRRRLEAACLRPPPVSLPQMFRYLHAAGRAACDPGAACYILTAWAVQQAVAAPTEPRLQVAAAGALRDLASAGRAAIADIASSGGVPALAGQLSSGIAALQVPALVALRRLASQPHHFAAVAAAVGIPACLDLLRGGDNGAVHAATAALLTTLAAGNEAHKRAIIVLGGMPLLLGRLLGGTMKGRIWRFVDPESE